MRFKSGRVSIDVKYSDRGEYTVTLTTPDGKKKIRTRPPASSRLAVDSREAMRDSAHAALSFAADEGFDVDSYADSTDRGWHITGGA